MKIIRINDTIINLAEAQYITVIENGSRINRIISFCMNGGANIQATIRTYEVQDILEKCYNIMQGE